MLATKDGERRLNARQTGTSIADEYVDGQRCIILSIYGYCKRIRGTGSVKIWKTRHKNRGYTDIFYSVEVSLVRMVVE